MFGMSENAESAKASYPRTCAVILFVYELKVLPGWGDRDLRISTVYTAGYVGR